MTLKRESLIRLRSFAISGGLTYRRHLSSDRLRVTIITINATAGSVEFTTWMNIRA